VRYYLGYLLAWTAQAAEAKQQFQKAYDLGPNTTLGKAAGQLLAGIKAAETTTTGK